MAHYEKTIPELDAKGLRNFGLTTGLIVVVLFGIFFPWFFGRGFPLWPWVFLAVIVAWALIAPSTLGRVYQLWMRLGLLISRVTTPLVLGIVFYIVIMPFGLVRRMLGRDPMSRAFHADASTYRVKTEKRPREISSLSKN